MNNAVNDADLSLVSFAGAKVVDAGFVTTVFRAGIEQSIEQSIDLLEQQL